MSAPPPTCSKGSEQRGVDGCKFGFYGNCGISHTSHLLRVTVACCTASRPEELVSLFVCLIVFMALPKIITSSC